MYYKAISIHGNFSEQVFFVSSNSINYKYLKEKSNEVYDLFLEKEGKNTF